ncbi:MAG: hypothetical protein DDT42_02092 [candidate division WS2 bacterium]|uniref:Uncharacterized protein n=1 Tax=Psychracetigena formicireducens TaxID=2986056 RepID=A0A9E2BIH3_PSYF1|nr:hypothetical protein [Candidatus Psychracetigena formicireducens]
MVVIVLIMFIRLVETEDELSGEQNDSNGVENDFFGIGTVGSNTPCDEVVMRLEVAQATVEIPNQRLFAFALEVNMHKCMS